MHHRPRWKKWLFAVVKLAVLALLVWFLRDMLSKAIADLRKHKWELHPAWLLLAGAGYILGLMPVAVFWNRVMRGAGQEVSLSDTIRAWWVSQIVKYIPGKAMVLVVRTGMLRHPEVETTVVAASVFVETLVMMAVGSLVSFVVLTATHWQELAALLGSVHSRADLLALFQNRILIAVVAAFGMVVALGLPTYPPILKMLVKMLGVGKFNPTAADKLGAVPLGVFLNGWLMIAAGWFLQGFGLWATLHGVGVDAPISDVPQNTAAVAMSCVAGFLSFIPGGAGVRELVQTELLVGDYGQGPALVATIVWRLVMLVAEVLISSILYVLGPRHFRHKLGGEPKPAE